MGVSQCTTNGAPEFNWAPNIYVGDSNTASIVHQLSSSQIDQISCSDKKFDSRVCITGDELIRIKAEYFNIISQCEKWK